MAIIDENKAQQYIWINGELIKWEEAKIHALTHSLHYSGAAFEGERAYEGKVFKLAEHTNRLIESARSLQMQEPYSFEEIIDAHKLIIKENRLVNCYIRPLIWRGGESLNMTNKMLSVNLMIATVHLTPRAEKNFDLNISRWRKPHPNSLPPQVKSSGHYNMNIVSQSEAKADGYDDAIMLDWRGYVAECTTTNIFFVQDQQLITPIADAFLNGITRQTIIELAKKLGLAVKEKYIKIEELDSYEECFMTGTALEVRGVNSITLTEKKIVFEYSKITQLLKKEYANLVRKEYE